MTGELKRRTVAGLPCRIVAITVYVTELVCVTYRYTICNVHSIWK